MSGMMRYQRVSPDCLPLSNGKKPLAKSPKDDDRAEKNQIPNFPEGKPLRSRSSPSSSNQDLHFSRYPLSSSSNRAAAKVLGHHELNGNGHSRSGDIVLQWGHNKRSRGSRAEIRSSADDPSSSSLGRSAARMHRRIPPLSSVKRSSPSIPPQLRDSGTNYRSGEERAETRPPPKGGKMASVNGVGSTSPADRDGGEASAPPPPPPPKERLNLDLFEWPRIYLSLSRKEKEDDFMAMKGSKLPQRPKKRPKNVEKALQFVFPGMWLSDLSRGRYEVREKKSVKKKRRGLKGMENLDSDSD